MGVSANELDIGLASPVSYDEGSTVYKTRKRGEEHRYEVIEKAKTERSKRLDEATRDLLGVIGIEPNIDGKFDKDVWTFVKRTLDYRTRPDNKRKIAYATDPQSERVARVLINNIQKKTEDVTIPSQDCVCVIKKTSSTTRTVEIHYGGGEKETDIAFISNILADPNKFLIDRKVPIYGTNIEIVFRNPTDIPVPERVLHLFKSDSEGSDRKTKVCFSEQKLPMTFEQLKKLDLLSSSIEIRNQIGRHHKERYLEITEATVRNVVEAILSDLEKKSPESELLKLIKMDKDFVIKYVYTKARDEKDGDLSLCIGNLFEAVVQIEMRDGVNNDFLSETIWQKINAKRVQPNNSRDYLAENAGKTIRGGEIDLVSDHALFIRKQYQDYCRKFGLANSDMLIIESVKYIDPFTLEIKEKLTPTTLVEIKTTPSTDILQGERKQVSSQILALSKFIGWYNEQNPENKLSIPQAKDLIVIILRPATREDTIDKLDVVDNSLVHTVRSSVTFNDLQQAIKSKDLALS